MVAVHKTGFTKQELRQLPCKGCWQKGYALWCAYPFSVCGSVIGFFSRVDRLRAKSKEIGVAHYLFADSCFNCGKSSVFDLYCDINLMYNRFLHHIFCSISQSMLAIFYICLCAYVGLFCPPAGLPFSSSSAIFFEGESDSKLSALFSYIR